VHRGGQGGSGLKRVPSTAQELLLGHVAGQLDRLVVGDPCLVVAVQPTEQVGAGGVPW
jgi:hypothetical protein